MLFLLEFWLSFFLNRSDFLSSLCFYAKEKANYKMPLYFDPSLLYLKNKMKLNDIYMDFLFYKITRLVLLYIIMGNGLGVEVFWTQIAYLKNQGTIYKDQPVVQDWNLITANGPQAAPQFARMIADYLQEKKSAF